MIQQLFGESTSLAEIQAGAARLQALTGVDPDKCIKIIEGEVTDDRGFSPNDVFLANMNQGFFTTGPEGSEALEHDKSFHLWAVICQDPQVLPAYMAYAGVALKKLRFGDADTAQRMVGQIDYSLVTSRPTILDVLDEPGSDQYQDESLAFLVPSERERLIELDYQQHLRMLSAVSVSRLVDRAG